MGNEFIVEGKKYISASRVSKLCGYNSDYIGQLCRKGQLDCKRVGRVWFVEEESVKNHKIIASQTPRGRIPFSKKNSTSFYLVQKSDSADEKGKSIAAAIPSANDLLAFKSDLYDATDLASEENEKKQNKYFVQKLAVGLALVLLLVIAAPVFIYSRFNILSVAPASQQENIVEKKIASFVEDVVGYKTETSDSIAYSANVFYSVGDSLGEKAFRLVQGLGDRLAYAGDIFRHTTNKFKLALFDNQKGQSGTRERTGVAVLPSSKDDEINQQVKEYVVNSFSDEAEIVPDESGNSGVIKPVFKNESDQEYLYVIVPVKDSQN